MQSSKGDLGSALLTRRSTRSFACAGWPRGLPDGRGKATRHRWAAPRRGLLPDLGQAALDGDARHDCASVAFVLGAVLVLDVLVAADNVHHGVGTSGLGSFFHA